MRTLVATLSVLLVVLVAGLLAHRKAYGTWSFRAPPDRLEWCGRRYYKSHRPPVVVRPPPRNVVFRAPPVIGRQVLTDVSAAGVAQRRKEGFCPGSLYRRTGGARYTWYTISGGG
jgi:hypothetical protein